MSMRERNMTGISANDGLDMDMLLDNQHTYIQGNQDNPEIHFDLPLAPKMGWIKEIHTLRRFGPDLVSYALGT